MANFSKHILSGSTNGRPIQVNITAATGTIIHTVPTGTTGIDEIWIWVTNTATESRKVFLEHGGTATADTSSFTVPAQDGHYVVSQGFILNNGLISRLYATASETINAIGYVNRITI